MNNFERIHASSKTKLEENIFLDFEGIQIDVTKKLVAEQNLVDITETQSGLNNQQLRSLRTKSRIGDVLNDIQQKIYNATYALRKVVFEKNIPSEITFNGEFVPETELKKIGTASKEEKSKLLKEFKQKLREQKIQLAKLQALIVDNIQAHPDNSCSDLYAIVENHQNESGINSHQKELALSLIRSYESKHAILREIRQKYPEDNSLFEAVTGLPPIGKIEVIEGPVTFYFRCHDLKDYATIYHLGDKQENGTQSEKIADMSGGVSVLNSKIPQLSGSIIAQNSSRKDSDKRSDEIRIHEEQHALKKFFQERCVARNVLADISSAVSTNDRIRSFKRFLTYRREFAADQRGKDEILAYLRDGSSLGRIESTLTQKQSDLGIYDFTANISILYPELEAGTSMLKDGNDRVTYEVMDLVQKWEGFEQIRYELKEKFLDSAYRKTLIQGIKAVKLLRSRRFPDNEIVALLTHEPLSKWLKVVQRLKG